MPKILLSGITYYKLEDIYPGDKTKNCGLTGTEIDANFHFLRGKEIKDIYFNEEGNLEISLLDNSVFVLSDFKEYIENIVSGETEQSTLSGSTYDNKTGVLTLVLNGVEYNIEGFLTEDIVDDKIQTVESALTQDIQDVKDILLEKINYLSRKISKEIHDRRDAIICEKNAREGADKELQRQINAIESGTSIVLSALTELSASTIDFSGSTVNAIRKIWKELRTSKDIVYIDKEGNEKTIPSGSTFTYAIEQIAENLGGGDGKVKDILINNNSILDEEGIAKLNFDTDFKTSIKNHVLTADILGISNDEPIIL